MKYKSYDDIDILSLLDFYSIEHRDSGKNVSQGWTSVCCPFCQEEKFHCGISLNKKNFSCWVCGQKGNLVNLLKNILNLDFFELKAVFNQFGGNFVEIEEVVSSSEVVFPTRLENLNSHARNYLINRGFDPDYLIDKYSLKQTSMLSKLKSGAKEYDVKNRIICPIIMNRKIVSWSGRDFGGVSGVRWKHCPNELSVKPISNVLYNIDNATKDSIILVEGITDVMRMGDYSIGLLGVKYSEGQIYELIRRKFKKIVILFDASADSPAKKLAQTLSPFTTVQVNTLYVGDPGDLTEMEASKLRYYLLGF